MMIAIDWSTVIAGAALGSVAAALYFAGLAFGMRFALRRANPVMLLTLSAVIRIVLLLAVAWGLAVQGGPWVAAGFAVAFLIVRMVVTRLVGVRMP
jgi:hypothetical protein